jgi:hypothetical protein
MSALAVAMKAVVLSAKSQLIKPALADFKVVRSNVGARASRYLNVNLSARRRETAASIFAMKSAVDLETLHYYKTIPANSLAIRC